MKNIGIEGILWEFFFFNKIYFLSVDLHNTSYKGGGEVWVSKYTHPHYMSYREREKGQACKHTLPTHEQASKHEYIVRKCLYLELVLNTQDTQVYGNYMKH